MACWQLGLSLAAAAALISGGAAEPIFFVTAPDLFRVEVNENVFLSMVGDVAHDVPMLVYLTLPFSDVQLTNTTVVIPRSGSRSVTTTIRVEPRYLPAHGAQHHVNLGVRSLHSSYPFQDKETVLVTFQSGFVFIQTNKPIYTPNSEVKTNVISLDQNMLPSSRTLHIEVKNPEGISVKQFSKTEAGPNGFIQDLFNISASPMFGIWTIVASFGHRFQLTTNVTFEVREYVLPKFSVTVLPKDGYILQGSQSLEVDITASYENGKPVDGQYLFNCGFVRNDGTVVMMSVIKQGNLQEGATTVLIDSLDIAFGEDWFERLEGCRFHAEAIVEEKTTGHTEAAIDTTAVVVSTPLKFSHKHTVKYFKRGFIVHVKIDVQYANDSIASGMPLLIVLEATMEDGSKQIMHYSRQQTDEKGRVTVVTDAPFDSALIEVRCQTVVEEFNENQAELKFELIPYEPSVGNERISIIINDTEPLRVGETKHVEVYKSASGNAQLNYMCVTAGRIVHSNILRNVGTTSVLQIPISKDMVPRTRIIVYYFTGRAGKTYVTADSLLVEVEEQCGGEVAISGSRQPPRDSHYMPHATVNVMVDAPRDSAVAIMAVDTAVYRLRDKDRLTRRKMFNRMKGYDVGCGPGGGRTVSMVFEDSGMTVLTNAELDVSVREGLHCRQTSVRKQRNFAVCLTILTNRTMDCVSNCINLHTLLGSLNPNCAQLASLLRRACGLTSEETMAYRLCCQRESQTFVLRSNVQEDVGEVNANVDVRNDFRETWFFELLEMGNDTEITYTTSAPSSITTWELTAVSVSQLVGMCVAPPSSVRVFKDFFIQLNLPYSVVRKEQMQVFVTIFNYRNVWLQVDVSFTVPEGLCTGNEVRRTLIVPPNDANTTTFLVFPIEVGEHPIRVEARARSGIARDAVEKKLRVVTQGMREDEYLTKDSIVRAIIDANPRRTVVPNLISGLEDLVRLPTGNGEQTMVRLGPTLYVFKYLRIMGAETEELETRAYDFIASGIANELRFYQPNGAYSVIRARPGSTWLTAFVVKVFGQAHLFTVVHPEHVLQSVKWLIREAQRPDGAFEENHAVNRSDMIGAVKGTISMTAFVLVSLLETRQFLEPAITEGEMVVVDEAISDAVRFLEGTIQQLQRTYDMAIVAYALALAGSSFAEDANERLKESARSDERTNAVHWDPNPENYDGNAPFWLRRLPTAISIETTAYALLAQITRQDYSYAGRIVRWLSDQINYAGGFVSVQDTVVAMQALAEYSSSRPVEYNIDLACAVQYAFQERITSDRRTFHNATIHQDEDVEPSYSNASDAGTCHFFLNVSATEVRQSGNLKHIDITVCTRSLLENGTPMAVIDVGFYSGLIPVIQDLGKITNSSEFISSYEVNDRSVIFYSDTIPHDELLCVSFKVTKVTAWSIVRNIQAVPVHVYDYYNTDETCTVSYKPGNESPLLSALCTAIDCVCLRALDACGGCKQRYTSHQLRTEACKTYEHFAFKIRVDTVVEEGGFQIIIATVVYPIKTGMDWIGVGHQREFYLSQHCTCYDIEPKSYFLIVGSKFLYDLTESGDEMYRYLIDAGTTFTKWPRRGPKAQLLNGFSSTMTAWGCEG